MAEHITYEQSKKNVVKGLYLLAVVTLIEVFLSLLGKGYIIPGLEEYRVIFYLIGLGIIALSLYKAYYIIYEFMHMRYEVRSLALSVLLPTLLLVWAILAFFQEGNSWKERREQIQEFDEGTPITPDENIENDRERGGESYLPPDVYEPSFT